MFILSKYAQRSLYQAPSYLKKQSNFYKDISISEGLSSKEMITFSCTDEHQDVAEKYSPKKKKKNSNDIEYGSVEDP